MARYKTFRSDYKTRNFFVTVQHVDKQHNKNQKNAVTELQKIIGKSALQGGKVEKEKRPKKRGKREK